MKPDYNRNEYEKLVKFLTTKSPFTTVKGQPDFVRGRLNECIKHVLERGSLACPSVMTCGFRVLWAEKSSPFKLRLVEVLTECGYIK